MQISIYQVGLLKDMMFKLFALCIILSITACHTTNKMVSIEEKQTQKQELLEVLSLQEEAWNKGDIDVFMESYWKSDKLKFIGSRGLNYGWDTTINNYKKSYPTPEKMGRLVFTILDHDYISKDAAHITGKFELIRKEDRPAGYFTLVFKKINDRWKIVSDHTSG